MSVISEHFVKVKKVCAVSLTPTQVKLLQLLTIGNHLDKRFKSWICEVAVNKSKFL